MALCSQEQQGRALDERTGIRRPVSASASAAQRAADAGYPSGQRVVHRQAFRAARTGLAITFCVPDPPAGVELQLLEDESAIDYLSSDRLLAARTRLRFEDLEKETVLVGATDDSTGFSGRVLAAFQAAAMTPRTFAGPTSRPGASGRARTPRDRHLPRKRVPRRAGRLGICTACSAAQDALSPCLPRPAQNRGIAIGAAGRAA